MEQTLYTGYQDKEGVACCECRERVQDTQTSPQHLVETAKIFNKWSGGEREDRPLKPFFTLSSPTPPFISWVDFKMLSKLPSLHHLEVVTKGFQKIKVFC